MPTPWPQPRPLTTNVVAVTAAGATGAGAPTPAGAETASARPAPMRPESIRRMADRPPPRLAEEPPATGLLYRTFKSNLTRVAFSASGARAGPRSERQPAPGALPEPRADRARRHGRRVQGGGRRTRSNRRGQAARGPIRRQRVDPRPVHPRGAGGGATLERAEHGDHLRCRRPSRPAVHRDGVPARRLAGGPARARRRAARGSVAGVARAGGGSSRRRSRERNRPPRRQARELAAGRRRPNQSR